MRIHRFPLAKRIRTQTPHHAVISTTTRERRVKRMILKVVTPPSVELVSLEDAKLHLREDGNEQDAVINRLIRSAREQAEAYQNRAYLEQVLELVLERLPDMPVHLPRPPLVSLEAVTLTDEDGASTTVPVTDFIVDTDSEPGRLFFK